ncbi:MAG: beta-hydroxyacyl-ACP dehydratase [Candidatus Margulisiibacteriota bacterium]|nr:beta-hydroxyacyl-ACP dehydratase [Candidatus Margulisiibacteriota bacterium]
MLLKPTDILPQQQPFLFLDEYVELDAKHCLAKYTFKKDEWFFSGHFPNNPVVPGVVLIEAMAQAGVVSIGIFNLAQKYNIPFAEVKNQRLALFTKVREVEFLETVKPGETVFISCHQIFYRFNRSETVGEVYKMVNGERRIVCTHKSIFGQGVKIVKGG